MNESQFMTKLNEALLENQRIFKLNSAVLHKEQTLVIVFIVDAHTYDEKLDDGLKEKVENIVLQILPKTFKYEIRYKKTVTEPKYITKAILDFVYNEYPSIYSFVQNSNIDVTIEGDTVKVTLFAESYIYKFCLNAGLAEKLEENLTRNFMEDVALNIVETANKTQIDIITEAPPASEGIKLISVSVSEHIYGIVGKKPRYICEMKETEAENVTLCGALSGLKARKYKEKEGFFYTFSINDTTSSIDAKFFPRNKKAIACGEALKEGDILVMEGTLKFDKFSNGISMMVNKLARCTIDYDSIDTRPKYKTERERYINIHPFPYKNEEQKTLFASDRSKEYGIFKGKSFVVFDLETTGVTNTDQITEIGAVKIVDGEMTEIFHTLVNPQCSLSQDIIKLTGITDEMLADAPLFEDVAHDFYKFTRGAVLVAHNAPFDMSFIVRQGRAAGYNFDNSVADTLVLAKQTLKMKSYKLQNVCKELGVSLKGAHRAMNDTLATANIFKRLLIMSLDT